MRWGKLGQIYCPRDGKEKLVSHAANPVAILQGDDIYRVFFSGRDAQNRSSVGFVEMDIIKRKVIYIHGQPILKHGREDSFYSHGISLGNCYRANGKSYMLFMGWQRPSRQHWRGDIGRLVVRDDLGLVPDGSAPLMSANAIDPLSLSYPWVIREKSGLYRMWYGSTITWDAGNGEMLHVIKHAVSDDGNQWQRKGLAVPYSLGTAQAFSRPSVIAEEDRGYHMWFSYRAGCGGKYRIGYAYSDGGETWELRLQEAGIDVSPSGWDSEMIEYPFVFDHGDERYMLYNGNGYGLTGFGLAVVS